MAGKGSRPRKKKADVKDAEDAPKLPGKVDPQSLMKKAYEKVSEKLEKNELSSKAIDDLVKLMKLEKDLGGEGDEVKEVKVRWEPSEDESSNEG